MNRWLRWLGRASVLSGAALLAGSGLAAAATITGVVRNEAGAGLVNVDLDFINLCSGDNVFLSGDKTAADGSFSIVVASGTYDVHFTPPAGGTVAAADIQGLAVTGNAGLGTVTLHPGRLVSGTVRTPALTPAAGVDLKFVNAATRERVYLSKDVTNAAGQYAVRVPPGTWDVDYRPAAGSAFTDDERLGLVVAGADIAGLVNTLGSGFAISGTVRDKRNNKIKNVDVDVYDACTGRRLATAHDNTDVNGNYSVVVPAGTYTFNYDPPACVALESARSPGTLVDRSRDIGTEQLKDAVPVSGVVHDHDGLPLAGARLKFYDVTAAGAPRQAATRDRTAADGTFAILVPPGTYDVNIEPPAGVSELVGHLNNVIVVGAASVGTVTLAAGMAMHGHLDGPGGPAANVNINVVNSLTRVAQRIANDGTDAAGDFTVVVAPGTYDFQYDPPACSGLAPASDNGVVVTAPASLPAVGLVTGVHALGSTLDGLSLPVPNVDLDFYAAGTSTKLYTPNDQSAADGSYDVLVPPGTYDIKYIPSSLTRLRPAARPGTALATTQTLPPVTLADGWLVTGFVRDAATLAPIAGASVDFYPPGSPTPLWTPHHLTAADGSYRVAVDAGTWDLLYQAPPGAAYVPQWRTGVEVSNDAGLADILLVAGTTAVGPAVEAARPGLAAWPNPARDGVNLAFAAAGAGAELSAWDVTGRRVATIWRGTSVSALTLRWAGSDDRGAPLPAGVYYLRLTRDTRAPITRRVALLR